MKPVHIASWSNILPTTTRLKPFPTEGNIPLASKPFIPRGSGSSFGDSAYLTDGFTITSEHQNRILHLDEEHNLLLCEGGVTLGQVHRYLEDTDYSFRMYGGSQWVTVGGAIASDLHGKNHRKDGAFGHHVHSMEIVCGNGEVITCSPEAHADLFAATIGGMGLTGYIKTVALKLVSQRRSAVLRQYKIINSFDEGIACFEEIDSDAEYYTEWGTREVPHQHFFSYITPAEGNCTLPGPPIDFPVPRIKFTVPFLVSLGGKMVRWSYNFKPKTIHPWEFNFIGIHQRFKQYNKLLGGVLEYQFAVSSEHIRTVYDLLIHQGEAKDLFADYVFNMKRFGDKPDAGLLSFPTAGYTIGIMAHYEPKVIAFFQEFTEKIIDLGGRIYLAKDSCLLPDQFNRLFKNADQWRDIVARYDPDNCVQSDLSNRLKMKP